MDVVHKIPEDSIIDSIIELAHESQYKTIYKEAVKHLKKLPNNQFWRVIKAYALSNTNQEEEAFTILSDLVKESVEDTTVGWIYYIYILQKNSEGYYTAVRSLYANNPKNIKRMEERYLLAVIEKDFVLQQKLLGDIGREKPNDKKYKDARIKLMAENPKTKTTAKMFLKRSHQTQSEKTLYLSLLKRDGESLEALTILEELLKSKEITLFEKRERTLEYLEELIQAKQYEKAADLSLAYFEEFKDNDYSAYKVLLDALKNIDTEKHKKYIDFVQEEKKKEMTKEMQRAPYLFEIEYYTILNDVPHIVECVLTFLNLFNDLRSTAADVFPLIGDEVKKALLTRTEQFKTFHSELLVSLHKDVERVDGNAESTFALVSSYIERYTTTLNVKFLEDGITLCDEELKKDEDEFEFYILKSKMYELLGMRDCAFEEVMKARMDIKGILLESVGYLIFPLQFEFGGNDKMKITNKKYTHLFNEHLIQMKDNINEALQTQNWEAYDDFFNFEEKLKNSGMREAVQISDVLYRLLDTFEHTFENGKFLKEKCQAKVLKIVDFEAKEMLVDNSDWSACFSELFTTLPVVNEITPFYDILHRTGNFKVLRQYQKVLNILKGGEKIEIANELKDDVISSAQIAVITAENVEENLKKVVELLKTEKIALGKQFTLKRNVLLNVVVVALTKWILHGKVEAKIQLEEIAEFLTSKAEVKSEMKELVNAWEVQQTELTKTAERILTIVKMI
ncbi:hypothetical protein EIN_057790 [Entamoeba invadens IP1]|uniref:hypothetical protein n=1 Tax=Entamoeba invadens IP1 TaxID=370355 RepID=UPI0002C3E1E9|nr:hypothetical protein EIN_057790 [Entamoeba invadens IP1]ELP93374.1 hypothetical protein EIN_057790 [Entamoeba invadens IP1]|eukprot:XP_004260145.1 hypothetical protein EIN_057790 [Entamoeba invadens IP1]